MNMLSANKKLGFTLIELLVVIAIIGIVMSIGIANLITAQKQARDASRRQIIQNIQTAFEQHYAATGEYPTTITEAFEDSSVPSDPREDITPIDYNVTASAYCVCATLEGGGGNASGATGNSCAWQEDGEYYCAQNKQ